MTAPSTDSGEVGLREALEKISAGYASCDGFQDAQTIATEALAAHQAGEKVSAPSQGGSDE